MKVVLSLVILLVSLNQVLGARYSCTNPEAATNLVYERPVVVEAPLFGRVEKLVTIPTSNIEGKITCVTVSEVASSPVRSVAVASVGISEGEVNVKLLSEIQSGIDVIVEVYSD